VQKFLILLVGIFVGNTLMNFNSSKNDAVNSQEKLKNSFVGEFTNESPKEAEEEVRKALPAPQPKAPQIKSVQMENGLNPEDVESEITQYFNEEDENDDDIDLGSAYRAEIRNESRKLQKKLIRQ
jgi:hypothetical protein